MICYVDSSVLLRLILGQRDALSEWGEVEKGVTSVLARVECLRTVDRLRLAASLSDDEVSLRRQAVYRLLASLQTVQVTTTVLDRATQPFPTTLGTLDAIHLSTALLWRQQFGDELRMATHDLALARAARACGLVVIGA